MPARPPTRGEHDRLDQELPQDVAGLAPTAMRRPISRVRSVTETSMMFMIPMPPTSSETDATPQEPVMVLAICTRSRPFLDRAHGEVVIVGARDAMALRA